MPVIFDPTKPAANGPVSSGELRGQFNALKALIDDCVTQSQEGADIAGTALNVPGIDLLGITVSDPPTQAEVQSIVDKLNDLIGGLKRL